LRSTHLLQLLLILSSK